METEGLIRGEIKSRSSCASKGLTAEGGVIDPSFRGEIEVILCNKSGETVTCEAGDRIAQIVFSTFSKPSIVELSSRDDFSASQRGTGGF